MTDEKKIELYLKNKATEFGGNAYKLVLFNAAGFPDRTILLPGGRIGFLELKAPGNKPTNLQDAWIRKLQHMGFKAGWADSIIKVDRFLDEVRAL